MKTQYQIEKEDWINQGKDAEVFENEERNTRFLESDKKVKSVYRFPNWNMVVFGYSGEQIPFLQGTYSEKLHEKISSYSDEKTEWTGLNGPI